jgi:hypothetical protein
MFEAWKRKGETSRSQAMCWWLISTFWKNRSVLFAKPEHPVFTVLRWSIFLNRGQHYIFHKLDHAGIFSGYAHDSWIIWLNFTQEMKKCLKLQEYELKLKIWSIHDEVLIEVIKMDIWNVWFGAQTRKLWHFENAPGYKTGASGLRNRRIQFSWIRPKSESRFSPYLVRILWFVKGLCPAAYIYVGHGQL